MAPTLTTVAFLATLTIGSASLRASKGVTGKAEQGLRGGRHLQAQPLVCSTLQCPDRSTPIADASITECGDACDAGVCCEAKCSYHQCPQRTTPMNDADEIVCANLTCTDDVCCKALCSYFQCPSGETLVDNADDILCPGLECSAGLCCEVPTNTVGAPVPDPVPASTASPTSAPTTVRKLQAQPLVCSTLQCPPRTTPIQDASITECGDECDADLCCEAKCSYVQCPDGETLVDDADNIVCPGLECSDGLCCKVPTNTVASPGTETPPPVEVTVAPTVVRKLQAQPLVCSTLQCPARSTPIADASITECGDACDAGVCCEAKCSYHQCPQRTTPVDNANEIVCDNLTCTDDVCCEALCSYIQCPNGETLVDNADDIVCPGLECSTGECCKVPTNVVDNAATTTASTVPPIATTVAPTESAAAPTDDGTV